jgi:small subunit ribosomal protein S6
MRPYEVMVILDAGLEEDGIRASIDRVTDLVSSRGGTPGKIDRWGKRRFAYELHHRWEGYYVLLEVTAEPMVLAEVDRMLSLADEVIRHKVIRLPEQAAGQTRRTLSEAAAEATPSGNGA